MDIRTSRLPATLFVVVLAGLLLSGSSQATSTAADAAVGGAAGPAPEIHLVGDVTLQAHRLAALVVQAAARHGVPVAGTEFELRYVDRTAVGADARIR